MSSIFIQWIPSIFPFQVTIFSTKRPMKTQPLPQIQSFLFPFQFYSGHKPNNSRQSVNTRTRCTHLTTSKCFLWCKINQQQKRWHSACSFTIRASPFSQRTSLSTRPISVSYLPETLPRWTRSPPLALRMSCYYDHKKNEYLGQYVLQVWYWKVSLLKKKKKKNTWVI